MQPEWLEVLKVFAPYVSLVATAIFAVLGWFARDFVRQMRTDINMHREQMDIALKAQTEKMSTVEKDFLKFQAQLPRVYVLKDDHIRHMTILYKKIDDNAASTASAIASVAGDIKTLLRESPKRKDDG